MKNVINIGIYNNWFDGHQDYVYRVVNGDSKYYVDGFPMLTLPTEKIPNKFNIKDFLKDSTGVNCPSINNYYFNTYTILSPFEFTLNYDGNNILYTDTNLRDDALHEFIGSVITNIEYLKDGRIIFQILIDNFYQSDDENVFIEVLDCMSNQNNNYKILSARLNIYDYPRKIHTPVIWEDTSKPLTIKYGQVLNHIRFTAYKNTYEKILIKEILNPNEVLPHYLKNYKTYNKFKINFYKLLELIRKYRKKKIMKL